MFTHSLFCSLSFLSHIYTSSPSNGNEHDLNLIVLAINYVCNIKKCSVQFSCSVVSDCMRPHQSQHARPPCPSPTPGVHPDSRPSSQGCHPAISSSVILFFSCPHSLPASQSFPMSQLLDKSIYGKIVFVVESLTDV